MIVKQLVRKLKLFGLANQHSSLSLLTGLRPLHSLKEKGDFCWNTLKKECPMTLFWIGSILIVVSYFMFVLSLMNLFPLWLSWPLFFFSILLTVHAFTNRHRFKGF
ncbi:hypothetical protein MM221_01775 [Salipaludibacillus sp. LMS25]|jgi:hypothetical protein|uniref:hypothetical protein n=1 Tax=Salipaludibacillus sp. LMS25 TaxID=2924031 RepID=UPI0020D086A6|nr:hypothetical protein [Salipaludibacillus sp. LMS25]UTR15347.1 hypothetical protein MM221_01775 [Salipaludibacillus sp. LMS25]